MTQFGPQVQSPTPATPKRIPTVTAFGTVENESGAENESTTGTRNESSSNSGNESSADSGNESSSGAENQTATEPDENETEASPTAAFEAPETVDAGETISFNASESDSGGDDEIGFYIWEIDGPDGQDEVITQEPVIEYTFDEPGTTEIVLEVLTEANRRAKTTATVEVVDRSPTVVGRLASTDDEWDAQTVQLREDGEVVAENETRGDGSFTLSPDEPGTYEIVAVDPDLIANRTETDSGGSVDHVDLHALDTVRFEENDETVDVGSIPLPDPHELETVVVGNQSGAAVEGATVTYTHRSNGATVSFETTTDADGRPIPESDRPLTVAGDVVIEVEPPDDGFVPRTQIDTVTVDEATNHTVRLPEAINATLDVTPNPAPVGENVTVTVADSNRPIESVSWTVDDRERNDAVVGRKPRSIEIPITEPENVTASALVRGTGGTETVIATTIAVTEPERSLEIERPDRIRTHEPFTVTAVQIVDGDANLPQLETYAWELRDADVTIATKRTNTSTAEFTVEELGEYTLALEVRDEFGLTETTTTSIEADVTPAWATNRSSYFEIDDVEAPAVVEPGGTVPVTVTTTNTGEVPDLVDVTVDDDAGSVKRTRLELGTGETESVTLEHAAPNATGEYRLVVATEDNRATVPYTVSRNASGATTAAGSEPATSDESRELDLLPVPSVGTDVHVGAKPVGMTVLHDAVLTSSVLAILLGFGLVGYAVYARPDRERTDRSDSLPSADVSDNEPEPGEG
ncbi:PKD domain-containing protein [Halopiger thermotolerans]